MTKFFNYFLAFTLGIVTAVVFIYEQDPEYDDSKYIKREIEISDSLDLLKSKIDSIHTVQDSLQKAYDSLEAIPPTIKIKTIEKIKVINSSTNALELDSIIRTNW